VQILQGTRIGNYSGDRLCFMGNASLYESGKCKSGSYSGSNMFICPILRKNISWDEKDVFNPAVVVRNNKIYMIFRAEDKIGKYAGASPSVTTDCISTRHGTEW
jgi:hypothetical protein